MRDALRRSQLPAPASIRALWLVGRRRGAQRATRASSAKGRASASRPQFSRARCSRPTPPALPWHLLSEGRFRVVGRRLPPPNRLRRPTSPPPPQRRMARLSTGLSIVRLLLAGGLPRLRRLFRLYRRGARCWAGVICGLVASV